MKTEFIICLLAAAGLHASLAFVGVPASSATRVDATIEVGLENGTADVPVEKTFTTAPDAAPAPTPDETKAEPEQVTEPQPAPHEIAEMPPEPQNEGPAEKPAHQPSPPVIAAPPQPSPPAKLSAKPSQAQPQHAAARSGGGGTVATISTVRYRERAALSYPGSALRRQIGGSVLLVVDINESGRATDVSIRQSSGNADLDRAAVNCARQSTYEPYRVQGVAQPCRVEAPFRFDASALRR